VRDLGAEDAREQTVRTAFDDWAAGRGGPFALLAEDATWTIVGDRIVEAVAFFDTLEFTDLWTRVTPADGSSS
jgi:ketosteroid isomerase-like protein